MFALWAKVKQWWHCIAGGAELNFFSGDVKVDKFIELLLQVWCEGTAWVWCWKRGEVTDVDGHSWDWLRSTLFKKIKMKHWHAFFHAWKAMGKWHFWPRSWKVQEFHGQQLVCRLWVWRWLGKKRGGLISVLSGSCGKSYHLWNCVCAVNIFHQPWAVTGLANWSKSFGNFEVKGPVQALCDADQGFRCIFYFCFFSDTYWLKPTRKLWTTSTSVGRRWRRRNCLVGCCMESLFHNRFKTVF